MAKVHQAITSIQFPSRTDWASSKSVLMLSTGRGRQMAQGKGSDCETEPRLPPDASHKCRLSPVLLTSRLWTGECRPSLRGDEFARVAHRTQRNIYRFPTEGCHSETGGKKAQGKVCREELGALLPLGVCAPPCTPPIHLPGCSQNPLEVLWRSHCIGKSKEILGH